jgi:hypothetical protein
VKASAVLSTPGRRLRRGGDSRPRGPPRCAQRLADPLGGGLGEQHRGAGLVGIPGLLRRLDAHAALAGVEQDRADVDRRHAVHKRVVGLRDVGVPAAQPLDHVELPERALHVERLRHDAADDVSKLVEPPRPWHRDMAHVAADVEPRVVPPDGVLDAERDSHDPLAEAGDEEEPLLDVCDQLVVGRRGPLDDDRRPDVHVDRPALRIEVRHVRAGQPLWCLGRQAGQPSERASCLRRTPEESPRRRTRLRSRAGSARSLFPRRCRRRRPPRSATRRRRRPARPCR